MIKLCIFDLDGTLLYTIDTINYYVGRALERHGFEPIEKEICLGFVGNGARKLIERAFAYRGVTDNKTVSLALEEYLADYDGSPYYLTKPYDGIVELLAEMKKRDIRDY